MAGHNNPHGVFRELLRRAEEKYGINRSVEANEKGRRFANLRD